MPALPEFKKPDAIRRALIAITIAMFIAGLPFSGLCEMSAMTDNELSQITGHGFSEFSLTNVDGLDIARISLNMQASTWAEMDSMKMGYWDNGSGMGWDQNWTGVSMGSETTDMILSNFVIQTEFVNVNDAATRQLKSITIGYENVTGTLSGNFASLSRTTGAARTDEGAATYVFNGDPFLLHINVEGDNPGVWLDFGNAVKQ
ncbi:MAG: hypothetical protein KQI81_23490 [Deltaproteobacteria bacterium]|nr:hypothetical protein [Deltaproteobacteria bacterium]